MADRADENAGFDFNERGDETEEVDLNAEGSTITRATMRHCTIAPTVLTTRLRILMWGLTLTSEMI